MTPDKLSKYVKESPLERLKKIQDQFQTDITDIVRRVNYQIDRLEETFKRIKQVEENTLDMKDRLQLIENCLKNCGFLEDKPDPKYKKN